MISWGPTVPSPQVPTATNANTPNHQLISCFGHSSTRSTMMMSFSRRNVEGILLILLALFAVAFASLWEANATVRQAEQGEAYAASSKWPL